VAATLLVVCTGLYLVDRVYPDSPVSRFYMTLFDEVGDQLWRHGGASAVSTLQQAGLMGYGLGMSQQGLHNIKAEKPRLWQESGPSKLVAELGLPGGVLLIVLGYTFMRTGFAVIRLHAQRNSVHVFAGLFSLFIANVGASLVSAQIYGDPFVFLLMSFLAGTLLSGAGMTAPVKDGGHP